jgi:hypothetical protein
MMLSFLLGVGGLAMMVVGCSMVIHGMVNGQDQAVYGILSCGCSAFLLWMSGYSYG